MDGTFIATPPPWVGRSSLCKQNSSTSNILVGMSSKSHVSLKEKMMCDELVVCLDSPSQIAFILGRVLLIYRWVTCKRGEIGRQSYVAP